MLCFAMPGRISFYICKLCSLALSQILGGNDDEDDDDGDDGYHYHHFCHHDFFTVIFITTTFVWHALTEKK